ncbi:hypothetical protein ACWIGI_30710 [Nocardia sp. NPDC055321]
MSLRPDPRLRLLWRAVRLPLVLIALYLVLRTALWLLSERHGFGSADELSPAFLVVAAATTTLRLILLIVVPALLAYRAAVWLLRRVAGLRTGLPQTSGSMPRGEPGRTPRSEVG